MKLNKNDFLLYAVTDNAYVTPNIPLANLVKKVIDGGATMIQLREKNTNNLFNEAKVIADICKERKIPLIINDYPNIAITCRADGVHIGQKDISAKEARKIIGNDKILGVSAQTVEQALQAELDGADYLGVGAIFDTSTKADADNVSIETLKDICSAVTLPVVAIGGISEKNIKKLKNSGISGIAVVSAIFGANDIAKACKNLKNTALEVVI